MILRISEGNVKLGKIPSFACTPGLGCVPGVPCFKECYARKAYARYPNVRKAWDSNYKLMIENPFNLFQDFREYLHDKSPSFFRWFVSGDIPNQSFLQGMKDVALDFNHVKFLSFTKNHGLDFSGLPKNLVIIASMWSGGFGDPTLPLRKAWYQDGTETRVPADAMLCAGHCEACGLCWHLPNINRDVVFIRH